MTATVAQTLPVGWRSPVLGVRGAGFGRSLLAVVSAVGGGFLLAWLLLRVAGSPGLSEGAWLRDPILLVLYALMGAPLVAVPLFPLLWAVSLGLAARGWAGLMSVILAAEVLGLGVAHVALHGDVTTEAPGALLCVAVALAILGWGCWAAYWGSFRLWPGRRQPG